MPDINKRERLEEEFELEDESQAFVEYDYITSFIAVNYSLMADELAKLGDFEFGVAIDLACGLGDLAIEVAKRYPKLRITGIDISEKAVEKARERVKEEGSDNLDFEIGDVHKLSQEDNSVDLVVSHGGIHHWKDVSRAFSEIYRIMKPGGLAYLSDLRRDAPDEIVKEIEQSLPPAQAKGFINSVRAAYAPEELNKILESVGIKNFSITDQAFSRETIMKNKELLRKSKMMSSNFSKLSQIIII
ncbi:MAG: class I SAM-dependent methyltransferase, partial [Candidatus Omnitrophica bacterium]|nr:class I SAM-dependent methyltransferase [Candidatus Omnitrophota bacterium]